MTNIARGRVVDEWRTPGPARVSRRHRCACCEPHLGCELTPEEIIADFRTFYFETALSGFETNLVALENFVPPERILFGTDFPAVSPQMAGWYTTNVDDYFADRADVLAQVMHGNANTLLPRLSAHTGG